MTGIKSLFYRDQNADLVFNTAKNAVSRLTKKIQHEKSHTQQNVWKPLVEDSFRSPMIMGIGDSDLEYIVYYPKNSAHYVFEDREYDLIVEVLYGFIYDRFHATKYRAGDRLTIDSGDKIIPTTIADEAYIKITKKLK